MKTFAQVVLLSAVALTSVACTPTHMAAPADLAANGEELDVSNRSQFSGALADESFEVGPYQVTDVNRKWDISSETSVPGFTANTSSGGFSYQFHGLDTDYAGRCEVDSDQNDFHLEGGGTLSFQFAQLACSCHSDRSRAALVIDNSDSRGNASVTTSGGRYELSSVYDLEGGGTSSDPAGYRADAPDGALGAVDVTHPGRIWLRSGLSDVEREQASCLFAGLMLYQPGAAQ